MRLLALTAALLAALTAGLLLASAGSSAAKGPCGSAARPPGRYDHVVWIVMENKAASQIVGSPSAPYLTRLASQCGSAKRFFAETHPSLPNYIAMTSGSTQGVADDEGPESHRLDVASIFSQLGTGWRALEESMPSDCLLANSDRYAVRHNPAAYYTNVRASCQRVDVPLRSPVSLSARFTFVTPNLCSDTHDCDVATGDRWLSGFLPKVFAGRQYKAGRTAVFVTWDEDDRSASNHIATLVAAPSVRPRTVSSRRFTHYSMLRTTEELLGLGLLGRARTAPSMRAAFHL